MIIPRAITHAAMINISSNVLSPEESSEGGASVVLVDVLVVSSGVLTSIGCTAAIRVCTIYETNVSVAYSQSTNILNYNKATTYN